MRRQQRQQQQGATGRAFSNEAAALLEAGFVGAVTAVTDAEGGTSDGNGNGSSTGNGGQNSNESGEAAASAPAAEQGAVVAESKGQGGGEGKGKRKGNGNGNGNGKGEGEGEGEGEDGGEWEDGRRRSPICETAQILAALVKQRVKTLAFCRTRKLTELTLRYGHQVL